MLGAWRFLRLVSPSNITVEINASPSPAGCASKRSAGKARSSGIKTTSPHNISAQLTSSNASSLLLWERFRRMHRCEFSAASSRRRLVSSNKSLSAVQISTATKGNTLLFQFFGDQGKSTSTAMMRKYMFATRKNWFANDLGNHVMGVNLVVRTRFGCPEFRALIALGSHEEYIEAGSKVIIRSSSANDGCWLSELIVPMSKRLDQRLPFAPAAAALALPDSALPLAPRFDVLLAALELAVPEPNEKFDIARFSNVLSRCVRSSAAGSRSGSFQPSMVPDCSPMGVTKSNDTPFMLTSSSRLTCTA
mmetsp:Transcript_41410/g.119193  ORF Transcript_41410/g.119193 Transcript_41410/m.119193 type:complete len:306 (+) Transcript_41410:2939-3856(+)